MTNEKLIKYFEACAQPQSNYAIDNFIDGGQLTTERRFRQAIIELESATTSYEESEYLLAKRKLKASNTESKIGLASNSGNSMSNIVLSLKLKHSMQLKRISRSERSLAGHRREIDKHLANLADYEKELGIDGSETIEDIYDMIQNAERKHYVTKLAMDAAASKISQEKGISQGVIMALQQLPKEDLQAFDRVTAGLMATMSEGGYTEQLHGIDTLKMLMSDNNQRKGN